MKWKILIRTIQRIALPARHLATASGWINLVPYGAVALAAIGAFLLSRPSGEIAAIALLAALVSASGAVYELEGRLESLTAPKRIPHNRDELIAAIRDLEEAALQLLSDYQFEFQFAGKIVPGSLVKPKRDAYNTARKSFETQLYIAGLDFRAVLRYQWVIDSLVYSALRPESWGNNSSEDAYQWLSRKVMDATFRIFKDIDNGTSWQDWDDANDGSYFEEAIPDAKRGRQEATDPQ